jgi:hypothetical protein
MDLARFVTEDPPPEGHGRGSWQRRFEQIIGQGLSGRWIDATEAWGTKPNGRQGAVNAAERCGLSLEWRTGGGHAYLMVK